MNSTCFRFSATLSKHHTILYSHYSQLGVFTYHSLYPDQINLCSYKVKKSMHNDSSFHFSVIRKLFFWFHCRCFLPTTSIPPLHPMWLTCSRKLTPRPFSWLMSFVRYNSHSPFAHQTAHFPSSFSETSDVIFFCFTVRS